MKPVNSHNKRQSHHNQDLTRHFLRVGTALQNVLPTLPSVHLGDAEMSTAPGIQAPGNFYTTTESGSYSNFIGSDGNPATVTAGNLLVKSAYGEYWETHTYGGAITFIPLSLDPDVLQDVTDEDNWADVGDQTYVGEDGNYTGPTEGLNQYGVLIDYTEKNYYTYIPVCTSIANGTFEFKVLRFKINNVYEGD